MRIGWSAIRRSACGKGRGRALCVGLLVAMSLGDFTGALAQVDCNRLQAQLASAGRGNSAQAARYADAANRQQAEINRTAAHAQSIGCNNRQFLFFGSAPPPQCAGLQARIQQMRGNVASLQVQAQAASGEGQRRDLQARYDSYCRGAQQRSRGLFDSLFGGPDERVQVPIEDTRRGPRPDDEEVFDDDRPRVGTQAVCVRTCDGGFFPMSYSARRGNLDDLADLCKAQCPNVEVALYTYARAKDIDSAVSVDGDAYTSLKNAGKYRTKYDPTCACKPPNKSWVEALAEAETLLERKKTDIMVTPEKAEELSRAKVAAPAAAPRRANASAPPIKPALDPEAPAATATIAPGAGKAYGLNDGEKREEPAAGGARKRVRVIAPNL